MFFFEDEDEVEDEHGGRHRTHGHQIGHDELLRAGGQGGPRHGGGFQGRQHRHPGEDPGHRRLRRRPGGVPALEGPEADEARAWAPGKSGGHTDAPSAGVPAAVGGGFRGEPAAWVGGDFQGRGSGGCVWDNDWEGVPGWHKEAQLQEGTDDSRVQEP